MNASTSERDRWREIDHAALVQVFDRGLALDADLGRANTDSANLTRLRQLGRKVITYTGLAEDVIPPATSVNHYERIAAGRTPNVAAQKSQAPVQRRAWSADNRAASGATPGSRHTPSPRGPSR